MTLPSTPTPPLPPAARLYGLLAQTDVAAWSFQNFGNPVVMHGDIPGLLRLMSHVGEFAHAMLKRSQGIRGDVAKHKAAGSAALQNILAAVQAIDPEAIDCAPIPGTNVSSFVGMIEELGELSQAILTGDIPSRDDSIGDILVFLLDACARNDLDASELFNTTWARVRQRNWKAAPADGCNPATPPAP